MRLANKVAIVTGASSGIGRASAYVFAKEGARLVVADIDDAGGEETVAAIKADGGEAIFVHTDVSKATEVENLVKATVGKFGRIDIFFNNAGTLDGIDFCVAMEEAAWDYIFAVDVKSIFFSVKYAVPEMKKTGGGVIINTASNSVMYPSPTMCCYTASKGAVITLTRALAVELAPDNIRVNCVSPSLTDTPLVARIMSESAGAELINSLVSRIPLGQRLVKPEEIARAALYLASDDAAMTSGINLIVDGASGL
ncbi:MAG: SDR family oxidoreductase [Chloroflexota bacterium]